MRTVGGTLDRLTLRQQRLELMLRESVTRLHGGLAGHHVEHVRQQPFGIVDTPLLTSERKRLDEERTGLDIARKKKTRHRTQ